MSAKTMDDLRGAGFIDSRDLTDTLSELEERPSSERGDDEQELVDAIRELAGSGIEDWEYGATLIRADHFIGYARELAQDIGRVSGNKDWPLNHVDWARAADELQADYALVDFLGHDYLVRGVAMLTPTVVELPSRRVRR